jgi:two-component system, OmpR family, phosphate regulon response regulator PhoB
MKKVLIIDDHSTTRDLVKWALSESGLKLHEASNGEAGLQAAKLHHPDLILLDIMMPGELDGYGVCEQLRASDTLSKVKIVLLSANDSEADRKRGQEAGANAYLIKPFKPATLRGLVGKLLET